eukprot:EG_transcript_18089
MPADLQQFRSWTARRRLQTPFPHPADWEYREQGPKDAPAIVCLPPLVGGANVFYKQMMGLCAKGYRLLAVDYAPYFSPLDFLVGFDLFLSTAGIGPTHLLGVGLGAFLALLFAEAKPQRVLSLILCNGFHTTTCFDSLPCPLPLVRFLPEFWLRRHVEVNYLALGGGPPQANTGGGPTVREQLVGMAYDRLASRLTLTCGGHTLAVERLQVPPSRITLVDPLDSLPGRAPPLHRVLDQATRALIKHGGPFPFLEEPEEFNVHLEVHLRSRCGWTPPLLTADRSLKVVPLDETDYDAAYDQLAQEQPWRLSAVAAASSAKC